MEPIQNNTNLDLEDSILGLANTYRKLWKIELCTSEDIEEYGQNEYFGGKRDAFEEVLKLILNSKIRK